MIFTGQRLTKYFHDSKLNEETKKKSLYKPVYECLRSFSQHFNTVVYRMLITAHCNESMRIITGWMKIQKKNCILPASWVITVVVFKILNQFRRILIPFYSQQYIMFDHSLFPYRNPIYIQCGRFMFWYI